MYYPCSENEALISFVFAYANCWFSHAAARTICERFVDVGLIIMEILVLNKSGRNRYNPRNVNCHVKRSHIPFKESK